MKLDLKALGTSIAVALTAGGTVLSIVLETADKTKETIEASLRGVNTSAVSLQSQVDRLIAERDRLRKQLDQVRSVEGTTSSVTLICR